MTFERFIAKKFLPRDRSQYSGPLVGIATCSIALGVLVMIMSVCILRGFQREISNKVVGFGSHIVVKSYQVSNAYEETPISINRAEVNQIHSLPGVSRVQFFAQKGGMIKTQDQIHGIIMKGVDADYDSTFFAQNLVEGRLFDCHDTVPSNEIIISSTIAKKLGLSLDDKAKTYFWTQDTYRARALKVVGIYNTDLTEFDEHYIIGDLRQIQKLNGWDSTQTAGYEILVDDFRHLDAIAAQVLEVLGYDLTLSTIVEEYPSMFSWLDLLNSNITLIIAIMGLVCVVAVISALLIMIFEKTSTIGLLKTLGATNKNIRNIFLYKASGIILKGILIGESLGLALCLVQNRFQIVKLDSESYSMSSVPIDLSPALFLAIGIGTFSACLIALLLPASHISKIAPAKTIKTE